jgi:mannose-1-phosphate guanylyltransferase
VAGNFGWDDVGTWSALRRVKPSDESGNVKSGDVFSLDSGGNVVHAEGSTVVLYGVNDLVIVTKGGLTLVTTSDRSADLKHLIDSLPDHLRNNA